MTREQLETLWGLLDQLCDITSVMYRDYNSIANVRKHVADLIMFRRKYKE